MDFFASAQPVIQPVIQQASRSDYWWAQPTATVLAALGVIAAAIITFKSQEKTRTDQKNQHDSLMAEARRDRETQQHHNDAALAAQREEWQARLRHDGWSERAARLGGIYSLLIQRMFDFELLVSLHETETKDQTAEERSLRRQHQALKSLAENYDGQTMFGLNAQINVFGNKQVKSELTEWIRLALHGFAIPEITSQRITVERTMAAHINSLEMQSDET